MEKLKICRVFPTNISKTKALCKNIIVNDEVILGDATDVEEPHHKDLISLSQVSKICRLHYFAGNDR
jgi:hypothetical protein